MCGKMVTSCGMTRTSHCALQLGAGAEHMNNTTAHTTIHNPYGIAGVRSSTIYHIISSEIQFIFVSVGLSFLSFFWWVTLFSVLPESRRQLASCRPGEHGGAGCRHLPGASRRVSKPKVAAQVALGCTDSCLEGNK